MFTEQGETITKKYANPRITERNLEQMLNVQIRARAWVPDQPADDVPAEWFDAATTAECQVVALSDSIVSIVDNLCWDRYRPKISYDIPCTLLEGI